MSDVETRFRVEGMDCAACVTKVTNAVRRVPGVESVSVSLTTVAMTVSHAEMPGLDAAIARQLKGVGYKATPLRDVAGHEAGDLLRGVAAPEHDHGPASGPWWRLKKSRLTLACGLALVAAFLVGEVRPDLGRWAFLVAMLVGLVPIARRAVIAALTGTPFSIEMLMTVAAVGAAMIGATGEAATVVVLFLVGEMLEGVAAGRARASIQGLTTLLPKTALIEGNGKTETVPAEQLRVGTVILVRPGDRIAADGDVVDGVSIVDEAPVTGESTPRRKRKGDPVFAGTINTERVLRVRVTAAAADNTIARVVKLVEEAQESKAPTERFIDRFSTWYTPAVVAVAALAAVLPPLLFGQALAYGSIRGWRSS